MHHPILFTVTWTVVAVYCAALLVAAVRIGILLFRERRRDETRPD